MRDYFIYLNKEFLVQSNHTGKVESAHESLENAQSRCSFLGVDDPEIIYKKVKANILITGSYGVTCPFCGMRHYHILENYEIINFNNNKVLRQPDCSTLGMVYQIVEID